MKTCINSIFVPQSGFASIVIACGSTSTCTTRSNSNWPYTVNNDVLDGRDQRWLRPTNVLQSRMFKVGAEFQF